MFCVLDRETADAAGAGMDQDALPGLRAGAAKTLQRGQPYQRQGGGLRMREGGWLERDQFFGKRDRFCKGADAVARRARVNRVAQPEFLRARAHRCDDAAGIEAEGARQFVFRDPLEVAAHGLEVDRV